MTEITLELPFPPSLNMNERSGKGNRYSSPKYVAWKNEAGINLKQQTPPCDPLVPLIEGTFHLSIQLGRPDKRRRDLDNLIKPISDLLQTHGVIEDDCWAQSISIRWAQVEGAVVNVRAA